MIRCKDCVYAWKYEKVLCCEMHSVYGSDCVVGENHFCSYGSTEHDKYMNAETVKMCEWHDIQNKPDDLPKNDGLYWVHGKWTSGRTQEGECEFKVEDGYFDTQWNFNVIAWKSVNPFDEV